jgi:hypothetical protein
MDLHSFLTQLKQQPEHVEFEDTMSLIETFYQFSPTAFSNGGCQNAAGQKYGSCKILAFGQLNDLSVDETLACFGRYYRDDVLNNPNGDDHQNIRHFMLTGWDGVTFSATALTPK